MVRKAAAALLLVLASTGAQAATPPGLIQLGAISDRLTKNIPIVGDLVIGPGLTLPVIGSVPALNPRIGDILKNAKIGKGDLLVTPIIRGLDERLPLGSLLDR